MRKTLHPIRQGRRKDQLFERALASTAPLPPLSRFCGIWQVQAMVDIVDTKTRSRMMSGIRGKDTKPELALRRALHARGFRFRLHVKSIPGRPDIVFSKYRAVVFVHGCFWHRHADCPKATMPATRTDFWQKKFSDNVERDRRNIGELLRANWRVLVVWECELSKRNLEHTVDFVSKWLKRRDV
jgi:DNA mismatch endonuclease (patch repair protein)